MSKVQRRDFGKEMDDHMNVILPDLLAVSNGRVCFQGMHAASTKISQPSASAAAAAFRCPG